ncbi:MAG: InlB B-repeat-containing protein, partial [Oscillospiraceae bacterium]|nr:InlB B-repeat-containing protein [Oscillospiraceae bacterium]
TGGVIESRAVLLQWMQEDPVDTWEMGRNDAVQSITGVRNVFVDYPELAFKLLGESVPANYTTPSGGAISYTVTATSNNTSYGTVSVSGNVITASPNAGYYAAGYTVTSGTATVTQNGNTFTVSASANCTVRINFAAATTLTVTFSTPAGVTQSAMTCTSGASITLPTPSGTPTDSSHDYSFDGWVTAPCTNVTEQPTILAAGDSYTPSASVTLYALYEYATGGSGSSNNYTKITSASQITDGGSYVFTSTSTGKAMSQTVESNWVKPGGTYSGDTISSPASTDVWTVSGNVISCSGGKLYSTAAKNISLNSSSGTAWTFAASGSGFQIKNGNNIMSYNSTGWRPYNGGYGSDNVFYIYKAGTGGTTYYTTVLAACSHTNTTNVAAVAATCTEGGYTAGVICNDCGEYVSGHTQTAALGHSYGAFSSNNNGTHSKTCSRCADVVTESCTYTSLTSGTTTTFTCSVCAYSYQTQLGTYTVTYNDCGATTTASCVEGGSVNLPATASTIDGYTFVGWVESAINDETLVAPTIRTGSFTPYGSVTLYACYTRTEESTGGGNYEKVTSDSDLTDGLYLIVNESAGRAMDASKESSIGSGTNYIAVTVSNDTIASTETVDASAFTYSAAAGTFATPGGLYICRTSGTSGGAVTTSSTASSAANTITISNGSATVACGSYYLRYNTGGYFRYYTSASQQAIQLYKKSGGSATNTYYTTNPDTTVVCEHENTTLTGYVAATCTTAGYTGDYVCDDCGATVTTGTAIPATGHTAGSTYGHNDNQHWLLCSVCGEAVTTTAESHTWGEYVITTPATEAAAGEKTSTCSVCGATRTQAIPALGYDYTVSFSVPAGVTAVAPMSCNSNGSISLPSAGAPADYTFVGWVETALAEDSATAPETVYAANGSYTASGNVTLIALYSYTTTGGTGTPGSFTLVTGSREDWSGEYVLTNYNAAKVLKTDAVASPGDAASAVSLANTGITLTGDTMTGVSSDYILVAEKIDGSETNYSLRLKGSSTAKYLNTANSNGLSAVATNSGTGAQWTISVASNGKATIKSVAYTSRTIRYNTSSYQFRTYTTGQGDVYLYGGSTTGTMYTTSPQAACAHPNLTHTAASAATCTSAGNSEYWYCADCGKYFSDSACETQITQSDTVIPATGHSYTSAVTTAATCTTDGVTTFTCASCGDTYTETIAALGHSWDAGVQTTAPTATTTGVMTYTCTRCGATRTESIPALGVTQHYARATSVTSGSDYVMVFHYTYNSADTWFMVGDIGSSTSAITEIDAPVNDVISLEPGEANLWNIATNDDGYALKLGSKYLSGTSTSTTLSNSNTPVTWTLASGSVTDTFRFKTGSRAIGLQSGASVRNYALSNESNTGTNYNFDIYLFANACAHTNTQLQGAYDATCTTNGYTGDLVCLDCGAVVTPGTVILQGHDYVEVSRTQPTCTAAGNIHYECSRCDSTKDVAIEALGHDYQQTAHQDVTCTVDGFTTYTCSRCGDSYTDTVTATGHNYDPETGICANCGDQLASYTVSFTVPAGINAIADITAFAGATVTLPTPTGTLLANAEDYVFAGWVTADVADSTNVTYTEPGSYVVTGNVTFKALYTWIDEANSFGTEGVYKLLTENDLDDLDTGWKLIIANDGVWQSKTMAMAGYANSGHDKFVGANVTVSNNTITLSSNTTVQQFSVVKDAATDNYYLISDLTDNEGNAYYLTSCTNTASANDITLTANPTAAALWEITYNTDGTVKLTAQGSYTANTVLFNSSNYNGFFSCYGETYYTSATKPSNIYGIRLFASNPIYHFTTAPAQNCEHEHVIWTDNGDGTCSCTCADCDHIVVDHQAHAWTLDPNAAGTVAANCTLGGKDGYYCANCSATKLENTDPLGHDYVGVETTAPTCSATGVMTYTCSRCGDVYAEAIPAINHTFVNGECSMCGAALYVLVTEAPENWEGEYLIVYVANDNAKVFDGKNDGATNYTVGTFYGAEGSESSLICVPNPDDYVMNFVPTDGGYNIMNADADWWSYTAASNGFSVNTNTAFAGKYTISLDASGNALITNAGNRTLKFNTAAATSGGDRFRFYGSSVYTTIKLYEKYGTCHHNWVLDSNASTAATCTAAGNNVYECSLCGETKNETVAALGHDYLYETIAPTCTEQGYTICTCSRCDYEDIPEYSVTAALGHDFSVLVEDSQHYIAPTCTESGLAYYQCSRCDAFSEEGTVLDPTGHNFVNGTCTICGATLTAQTYTLMTSLNFANAGSVLLVFEYDGAYYAVTEEVSGRCLVAQPVTITNNTITIYDDGTYAILIPQTSLNDGTNTGTGFKTVNNDYLHVNTNALAFAAETANAALAITPAQVWSGEYDGQDNMIMNNVANAYFLQGKTTGKYVSNLVNTYEDSMLTVNSDSFYAVPIYFYASSYVPEIAPEPSEHNTIYVPGSEATCTEAGYMGYYMCIDQECECAGKMYADIYCTEELLDITIPALGHNYVWDGTIGDGEHLLECTRCGDCILETCDTDGVNGCCSVCGYAAETPDTLQILSAALVLNGKIDVAYTARIPDGYTNPRMVFVGPNGTMTVTGYTRSGENYVFTYTGINPQCMGDNVSATLYATKNDVEESNTQSTYSVRQYCVNKLADNTISANLRTLLSDMLVYGAAAQTYMGYHTNALVNSGSDIINPTCSTFVNLSGNAASFDGAADANIFWLSAGLTLTDSVAMTFRFHADDVSDLTVYVTINGRTQEFTEFTAAGEGVYEVSFTGISAEEFGDTVTAVIERDDEQIGNELSYSVNAYVQSKQADSNAALAALVKALYNFGASAVAFAG